MNFNIVENPKPDYDLESVIKDYTALELTTTEIRSKHGITCKKWSRVLTEIQNRGIPLRGLNRKKKMQSKCKYYYHYGNKWVVQRTINGELHYFGRYGSEREAKKRVRLLHDNGWGGLIKHD